MKNLYERSERASYVEEKINTSNNDVKSIVRLKIVTDENENVKKGQTEIIIIKNSEDYYKQLTKEFYSDISVSIFASTVIVFFIDLVIFLVISNVETLPVILGISALIWTFLTVFLVHQIAKSKMQK